MAKWGRGWEVGIRREAWEQAKALEQAARILKSECGVKHQLGERRDLCPVCIEVRGKGDAARGGEHGDAEARPKGGEQ